MVVRREAYVADMEETAGVRGVGVAVGRMRSIGYLHVAERGRSHSK